MRIEEEVNKIARELKEIKERLDSFDDSIDGFASNSDLQGIKDDLGNSNNLFLKELASAKKSFKRLSKKIARVMPME